MRRNRRKYKKSKLKIVLLIILFLGVAYYTYITIATHHIMVDLKQIENGCENDNPAYVWFESEKSWEKNSIRRYFTWCWGDKGAIWITCRYSHIEEGKIIDTGRDYTKLIVEKKNGKWTAVRTEWEP